MTEALKTDVTYTIQSEPFYNGPIRDKIPALAVGDRVQIVGSTTPDHDGDVRVKKVSGGSSWYLNAGCLAPAAKADDFKVGDRVRVATDAKTASGSGVYFHGETEGVVEAVVGANLSVRAPRVTTGVTIGQHVAPEYLTKLDAEAPAVVSVAALTKAADLLGVSLDKVLTFARAIEEGV